MIRENFLHANIAIVKLPKVQIREIFMSRKFPVIHYFNYDLNSSDVDIHYFNYDLNSSDVDDGR